MSPANVPIFQFKLIIVAAGVLLLIQGVAQVFRCIICLRTGRWPPKAADVEETETLLVKGEVRDVLQHGSEAVDTLAPDGNDGGARR